MPVSVDPARQSNAGDFVDMLKHVNRAVVHPSTGELIEFVQSISCTLFCLLALLGGIFRYAAVSFQTKGFLRDRPSKGLIILSIAAAPLTLDDIF